MAYVLILGSTSDIGRALAHEYAENGYDIYLAARRMEAAEADANDIRIRYKVAAQACYFDALDFDSHQAFFNGLDPKPYGVVCMFGYLGDQETAQSDFAEARKIIDTNYTACVSITDIFANYYEEQKKGFIVGVSSVAGDRGRKSNYIYGSAKAGFSAYLSGLRSRLYESSVHVLTVKPGFVYTKMTEHMELPDKLTAQPDEVARDIYKAQQRKKDVLYTKWYWFWILCIVKHIPERIFKRLNF